MEGSSLDELHANIMDAVQLLFAELMESGELPAFLKNRGWHLQESGVPSGRPVEFDVPIELLIRSRDTARSLLQ